MSVQKQYKVGDVVWSQDLDKGVIESLYGERVMIHVEDESCSFSMDTYIEHIYPTEAEALTAKADRLEEEAKQLRKRAEEIDQLP